MLVIHQDSLVCFLYTLIRDTVPPGEIERILKQVEATDIGIDNPIEYSNRFLADYARSLVKRLSIEI